MVVILLCNRDYFGEPLFEAVNDHVERVLSGDTVELPPGLPAGSTADVSALVGTYRFPDGAEISLSAWNRGLIARGTDQRVIDLLYFPQIVSADTHAVLNHTIERCLLPILSGNWEPLGEILSDSETRLPRIRQLFEIMMSSRALESGPVERARIIGTYPSDRVPGAVETVAELYGAESHLFFRFIWEDNLVVGVGPTHERFCAETVLMPTSTDILVGYHLAGARPIRLAIIRDSAGRLTALTFADGESPVSAARIP